MNEKDQSKWANEVIDILCQSLDIPRQTHEFCLEDADGSLKFYDFKYKNILIELHGDFFHANPLYYTSLWTNPVNQKKAIDIWAEDEKKRRLAEENGFVYIELWKSEFEMDEEGSIESILGMIQDLAW